MPYKKGDPRLTAYKRASYQRNKAYYRKWNKAKYEARKQWMAAIKSQPCADCGQTFPPYVMDFDHLPQFDKAAVVSRLFHASYHLPTVMAEIAKCQLVCSNCHRIRTHNRKMLDENPDNVRAIAVGDKPVPAKLNGQILFNAVEAKAIEEGDEATLRELAASPLGKKLSQAGQTLGGHGYNDNPVSAVEAIQKIQAAREAAVQDRGLDIPREIKKSVNEARAEVKKAAVSSRPKWEDFIQQITCGY